jgi:hypothetical protein
MAKKKKKDLKLNSADFAELSLIVYERNTICRKRTAVRNKLYRMRQIQKALTINNDIKRDSSTIVAQLNKQKKFEQSLHKLQDVAVCYIDGGGLISMNDNIIDETIAKSKKRLEKLGDPKKIPKKYTDMRASDIALKLMYLERDMAQVTIDQYEFTDRTRRALASLCKRYNICIVRDRYYNRINAVQVNGNNDISAKEFEDHAINEIFEREVFK